MVSERSDDEGFHRQWAEKVGVPDEIALNYLNESNPAERWFNAEINLIAM
jgi:hypothetical protein